eukprot:3180879-Amphidinium_carterae.1
MAHSIHSSASGFPGSLSPAPRSALTAEDEFTQVSSSEVVHSTSSQSPKSDPMQCVDGRPKVHMGVISVPIATFLGSNISASELVLGLSLHKLARDLHFLLPIGRKIFTHKQVM